MANRFLNRFATTAVLIVFLCIWISIVLTSVFALPIGPVATSHGSSTRTVPSNASVNDSTGGGYIYTYSFDATEQNNRWKGYVGNVTGTLTLDDANNFTIYSWPLGVSTGEVYATRNDSAVAWTQINCSWAVTGNFTNRTISEQEDTAMQHSRLDNITATFNVRNHSAFQVGTRPIDADSCYSIFPYVNDSSQTSTTFFPEVMLYDGTTISDGKIVYAALTEADLAGYNGNDNDAGNETYDFQMVVPEIGSDGFSSSTAYYFYVELT